MSFAMNFCPWETMNAKVGTRQAQIKRKFRKLQSQYHPDKTVGLTSSEQEEANVQFFRVNQSCEVLLDKRLQIKFQTASVRSYAEFRDDELSNTDGWRAVKTEQIKIVQEEARSDEEQQMIKEKIKMERIIGSYSVTDEEKKQIQEENIQELGRRCKAEEAERTRALTLMQQRKGEEATREIGKRIKSISDKSYHDDHGNENKSSADHFGGNNKEDDDRSDDCPSQLKKKKFSEESNKDATTK